MNDYLRNVMQEQRAQKENQANAELDCNRSAFFDLLCRPNLDRTQAAFLIANIQINVDEGLLRKSKKQLLNRTKMLIGESSIDKQPPTEWLRWALGHEELLLGYEHDKDRITQIVLAFDRHQRLGGGSADGPVDIDCLGQKSEQERGVDKSAEARPSHLLAIAALLELLKAPDEFPRPKGRKQEAIKDEILNQFHWRGLSKRNLEDMFSAANKAKADAE